MIKEINGYAYQVSKNDVVDAGTWSLVIAKGEETKPLIEIKFKTKAQAMDGMKKAIIDMQKPESYKLGCGHNNAMKLNLFPFQTYLCLECGFRGEKIKDIKEKKQPDYKKAYYILMDYFDYLPDEDKKEVDKELKRCGL